MLPMPTDNGARLAAVLPTAIASMAKYQGCDPSFLQTMPPSSATETKLKERERWLNADRLPAMKSMVVIVVDGLGHANLKRGAGHARTLSALPGKRIETVAPSTTGAALTTITTGTLPGTHGLLGYKIRHPELGLLTTLKGWDGVTNKADWQRSTPLFSMATQLGARAVAVGRPAHKRGGFTEAILSGAEYIAGQTIAERFEIVSKLVQAKDPVLAYLYVDELDKAAHTHGGESQQWLSWLERLDGEVAMFLRTLPSKVGVVITADHGIVDVPKSKRLVLEKTGIPMSKIELLGGEPRMRSLYIGAQADADEIAASTQAALGKTAWVSTRKSAIEQGWFGAFDESLSPRIGEVLIAARAQYAFMLETDHPQAYEMVGHHGSLTDEERGIPLIPAGGLEGTGFANAVHQYAFL